MMPGLARRLSEVENDIKRQNALKSLCAEYKQVNALPDPVSPAINCPSTKSQTFGVRIHVGSTDHPDGEDSNLIV